MEPTRKPTVSPTPLPAPTAQASAAPTPEKAPAPTHAAPATKARAFPSRETRLGAMVAVSFLAVAGGVLAVKHFTKEPESPFEVPVAMKPPSHLELTQPPSPPSTTRFTPLDQSPPAPMTLVVPEIQLPPQPIQPVRAEVPVIADFAPPPIPAPPPSDVPLIVLDPIVPNTPIVAIDPVIKIAPPPTPREELVVPITQPKKDDFSSKPPMIEPLQIPAPPEDVLRPEARNPVIRTGVTEPKKSEPARMDAPPIIDVTPPGPIEAPPKIEVPAFEPPVKKEMPPLRIEMASPQPEKKIETPATVDLAPRKLDAPAGDMKKDGEFDEDLHSLKQNESYRLISKQYYNSEAYAVALQRYNRDHPGQADYVRIPPIWVLEKKYTADIAGSQARAVNFTTSPLTEAAPRNEPVYTVGENGEMLAEIARKQLGSEDAWKRIWDLNPQVNPAKAVPGGTRLRMPGL